MDIQSQAFMQNASSLSANEDFSIFGRRFREVHYHRFPLGLRSFMNGFCVLNTCIPSFFSRPTNMQTVYSKPPANLYSPQLEYVYNELNCDKKDERIYKKHFIVANTKGLTYFISGKGFWNTLDIPLGLNMELESCIGLLVFETSGTDINKPEESYKLYVIGTETLPGSAKNSDSNLSTYLKSNNTTLADKKNPSNFFSGNSDLSQINNDAALSDINQWPFLEQRLFLPLCKLHSTLNYIPMNINKNEIPEIFISGSDNLIHKYLLTKNEIIEITDLNPIPRTPSTHNVDLSDSEKNTNAPNCNNNNNSAQNSNNKNLKNIDAEKKTKPSHNIIFTSKNVLIHDDKLIETQVLQNNVMLTIYDQNGSQLLKDFQKFEFPILKSLVYHIAHKNVGRLALALSFVKKFVIVYHDIAFFGLDTETIKIPINSPNFNSDEYKSLFFPNFKYKNIENSNITGVTRGGVYALPRSDEDGLVTCILASDLDYNGICELILGTSNGVISIYKLVTDSMNQEGYALVYKKKFKSPVYEIVAIDLNSDGLNELLITTLLGVHILQPNLALARKVLLQRLFPNDI
ncbi:hypothetical protein BB561_004444 [Smittium simulii]|uniref:Uncharacterized protein n=1 Tax=Smittium simulii TaxID=133385 RepID=A0A2T9YG88_9FUNG|nr:hypothetical protein BB561_004444 [Smittium simulii]